MLSYLLFASNSPISVQTVILSQFALLLLYAAAATFRSRLTTYSLEATSLFMEKKFLSTEKQLIPIKSIDNLRIKESFLGRLLGIADIYVDTPGGEGYELLMHDVPHSLAQELVEEVEKVKGGM
jgi:putative membrane protein